MARVTILGAGMMGSALTFPLVDAGHEVCLVGTHLDDDVIRSVAASGRHPTLGIELPPSVRPHRHHELGSAVQEADALIIGVSSAGVRWAGTAVAPLARPDLPVAMVTKGLEAGHDGLRLLPDVLADVATGATRFRLRPATIAGPCIAGELARRVPTCAVIAGRDPGVMERFAGLLATPYYRLFSSPDLVGVQICAALKNAYAMGMAFGGGLHEMLGGTPGSLAMHNHEAATFAQAVLEMQRLVQVLGGDPATAAGLSGVGDLEVTCNGGRTGRFGHWLGMGVGVQEAQLRMQGATLECLEILAVMRLALPWLKRQGLSAGSVPLLEHLMAVALDGAPVAVPFDRFFASCSQDWPSSGRP